MPSSPADTHRHRSRRLQRQRHEIQPARYRWFLEHTQRRVAPHQPGGVVVDDRHLHRVDGHAVVLRGVTLPGGHGVADRRRLVVRRRRRLHRRRSSSARCSNCASGTSTSPERGTRRCPRRSRSPPRPPTAPRPAPPCTPRSCPRRRSTPSASPSTPGSSSSVTVTATPAIDTPTYSVALPALTAWRIVASSSRVSSSAAPLTVTVCAVFQSAAVNVNSLLSAVTVSVSVTLPVTGSVHRLRHLHHDVPVRRHVQHHGVGRRRALLGDGHHRRRHRHPRIVVVVDRHRHAGDGGTPRTPCRCPP